MEQILIARSVVVSFYKRYEIFILPILRFFLGFYVFSLIGQIGYSSPALEFLTDSSMRTPYAMLMGLLFCILPISMGYLLMAFNIVLQFSANTEVAVLVAAVLFLILLFYGRVGGMERWLLLFTILGFYFGVPYIVPIIAGLYFGVQSIVPITLGVFLWEFYPLTFELMGVERPQAETIIEIPDSFGQVFAYGAEIVTANDQWVTSAFVFALVTLIVFLISKLDVDFSKEIAIVMGVVINIVSFIFLSLSMGVDVNVVSVIALSILSGFIVLCIKMFDVVLNYQRAERVEFEDDENYYFVKVVPKMTIARRERKIRQIKETPPARKRSDERNYESRDEARYEFFGKTSRTKYEEDEPIEAEYQSPSPSRSERNIDSNNYNDYDDDNYDDSNYDDNDYDDNDYNDSDYDDNDYDDSSYDDNDYDDEYYDDDDNDDRNHRG